MFKRADVWLRERLTQEAYRRGFEDQCVEAAMDFYYHAVGRNSNLKLPTIKVNQMNELEYYWDNGNWNVAFNFAGDRVCMYAVYRRTSEKHQIWFDRYSFPQKIQNFIDVF